MERKRKKTERLNPSPCERKILSSGIFHTCKTPHLNQSQPLTTLAQELNESLERYKDFRRIFVASLTNYIGVELWRH